ncbi:hypothetical protein BY458DRAFT_555773 [Sporodiniella umbellata]|nr:hypothetical protein BY458DRAFT_555773 [Sporodiniella umbellata]
MGLPIWKPKKRSLEELQEELRKQQISFRARNSRYIATTDGTPVLTRHSSSNENSPSELTPLERYERLPTRQRNTDTAPESWPQNISQPSLTQHNGLERIEQFIADKKNLLEQLQITGFLLEQFLAARTRLGPDALAVPEFITQDLPSILESAATLAAMPPEELVSSFSPSEISTDALGQSTVQVLLNTPPYCRQIQEVENSILTAHRRIRRQFRSLATRQTAPRRPSTITFSSRSSPPFHPSSNFRSPSTRLSRRIRFVDRDPSP